MIPVKPQERFPGTVVVFAPHMDDGVLACGGLIAQLAGKNKIHIVYATDGMKSPAPVIPWRDSSSPDLGATRMNEAVMAMGSLGIPAANIEFLGLPEAHLRRNIPELRDLLEAALQRIRPDHIFIPFRYDRHSDHLVINHLVTEAHNRGFTRAQLVEYFVYYRWRLLPGRDVRKYIDPKHLFAVEIDTVADQKYAALGHFKSQTTKFYPWQTRPILTQALLHDVCENPELFLYFDSSVPGAKIFTKAITRIRVVHRLEPYLQRWKYRVTTVWRGARS